MTFQEKLIQKTEEAEKVLRKYLPEETGYQKTILEAMNYSLLAGGKRLRPVMMKEVYDMFGGKSSVIEPFMAAQEMIHTYSLVHDDLPAMDNDEYRRGRKTTHAVYGEAMAILAGDGLLNLAYETACRAFETDPECGQTGRALGILSRKAGIYGMVGGQAVDVEAEKKNVRLETDCLMFIHEHKTAALIQSSLMIGAVLAGAGQDMTAELEKCGYCIGLAFQIQDDILDVTGNAEELGKPTGSDEKNQKLTYVSVHGLDKSVQDVKKISDDALKILQKLPERSDFLEQLVISLTTRRK